jgi:peptide deformylase
MIRPVYLLGNPELRRSTERVEKNDPSIQDLIDDMIDTMHAASGIGLAAPQIGRSERIFVVDISPLEKDFEESGKSMPRQPMVFVNAIVDHSGVDESEYDEGCLSIPDIHEEVTRPDKIVISFLDRDFAPQTAEFDGMLARVIQHEYDHVEGVLFLDHISPLRRRLLKRRLKEITNGAIDSDYPVYAVGKGELV